MNRFAPTFVLIAVTALLFGYGQHPWSWVAGPLAALFIWSLDRNAHEPAEVAPVPAVGEPAPVD